MLKNPAKHLSIAFRASVGSAMVTSLLTMLHFLHQMILDLVQNNGALPMPILTAVAAGVFLTLYVGICAAIISHIAFSIGIAVFYVPAWWTLHKLKFTNPFAFAVTGAALSAGIGLIVFPVTAPLLIIPGGVAGWIIWRLGYERP